MLLLSLFLLLGVNFFLGQRIAFQRFLDFLVIHFLILCAQIVLAFEIASLCGWLSHPWLFLLIQTLFLIGAAGFWALTRRRATPTTFSPRQSLRDLGHFLSHNKVFSLFAALVFIGYLGLAVLSMTYPQTTSDSLYNHLSRIGHWLQQSSLKPYPAFSDYGIIYPYNNSLLMMWSVLFLKNDVLVGLTQWFSAFLLAASIYGLGTELKFSQKSSAFASLIFLTFPIVLLEAGTAQNDLLAAAFFVCAFTLMVSGLRQARAVNLLFSALALALAIGTKQYVLFALPGLLLVFLYFVLNKNVPARARSARVFLLSAAVFTLLVGSYAYLQNWLYYGNLFIKEETNIVTKVNFAELPAKLGYNAARLTTQFVSCDGLSVPAQQKCLSLKETVFSRLFSGIFDPRSKVFLLETDCGELCFDYGVRYPLNEESAWFGPLSWLLLLPGALFTLVRTVKRRDPLPWLILLTALGYFAVTAVFKAGWDPYLGRYLILSTALVAPFSAALLSETKIWQKLLTWVVLAVSLILFTFTILANDSRTLITKDVLLEVQVWGKEHSLLATKIAYKLTPYFPDAKTYFDYSAKDIQERIDNQMSAQVGVVEAHMPLDASLGIIGPKSIFLDYYLFGDHFNRSLFEFAFENNAAEIRQQIDALSIDNVLMDATLSMSLPQGFQPVEERKGWVLYQR